MRYLFVDNYRRRTSATYISAIVWLELVAVSYVPHTTAVLDSPTFLPGKVDHILHLSYL